MKRSFVPRWLGFLLSLILTLTSPAADLEEQLLVNANVGPVTFSTPKDWSGTRAEDPDTATSLYRVSSPQQGFDLEVAINEVSALGLHALKPDQFEAFLKTELDEEVKRSIEGDVVVRRLGFKGDGAYARLTDSAPQPGEFTFVTKGVRLIGRMVVLFSLYSNDPDGAVLKKALSVVESIRLGKRSASRAADLL